MSDDGVTGVPEADELPRVNLTSNSREQLEQFRSAHETQVLTILLSDLEGSTRQQSELGNVRAAQLVQAHRAVFRETLGKFDGKEVETAGDSFLLVFAAPSEGVKFALHMQAAMRQAKQQNPLLPGVRVGIHQGQVVVERRSDGAKPMDIYGLQVSTAARIMDLGQAGQVLCSRAVFDDARAILRDGDLSGLGRVAWCNHGPYQFKGVQDAYDVCEVGEEGIAPLTAPPGSTKSWPAGQGEEELGWRPAAGVTVPQSDWVLLERLGQLPAGGEGGAKYRGEFGEVWKAWNPSDKSHQVFKFCFKRDRVPALKREARLLKRLRKHRHPNLVEVYDVTQGDRPPYYLEMEYVDGPAIEEWLAADPPLKERLEVVAQVADALDTVHAAGIYHRDIKPSNILLTHRQDGTLQAKLSDFGLGAAQDKELLASIEVSQVQGVAGTWDYIAPELRQGRSATAQSDLYSLGITLYQLAVGDLRRPLTGDWESLVDSEVLREDIRRCVAGAAGDRWASAAELARALRSHDQRLRERELQRQRDEHRRRARRLRAIASVAGLFAAVTVGFGGYALYQRGLARAERDKAVAAQQAAEGRLYVSSIAHARSGIDWRRFDLAERSLWQAPENLRRWEWGYLLGACNQDLLTLRGHKGEVYAASFSPDGLRVLTAGADGTARLWDAAGGAVARVLGPHAKEVGGAVYSPDGSRIVTTSWDGSAKLWNAATGAHLADLKGHESFVTSAAFSADGRRIATASRDGTAIVWDATTAGRVSTLRSPEGPMLSARLNRDGSRVVTTCYTQDAARNLWGAARVWDAAAGTALATFSTQNGGVACAAFSPDGGRVVTASPDGTALIWDLAKPAPDAKPVPLTGHNGGVACAAFDPEGKRVVTASEDRTAKVWQADTGSLLATLSGHVNQVNFAAFSPDGSRVVTTSSDGTIRLWGAGTGVQYAVLAGHTSWVASVAFSPGGGRIVSASGDGTAKVWAAPDSPEFVTLAGHRGFAKAAAFGADGRRIVVAAGLPDFGVTVCDLAGGQAVAVVAEPGATVGCVAISADGGRIVTGFQAGGVKVWDVSTKAPVATLSGHGKAVNAAAFSPDGGRVVTAGDDCAAKVWTAATGAQVATLRGHDGPVLWAAFSPDGTRVVTASADQTARTWDAKTGAAIKTFAGHKDAVHAAAFSPDGAKLVTASADGTAKVWDAATASEKATLAGHRGAVRSAAFSPDGSRVLTASADFWAKVWDPAGGEALVSLGGPWDPVYFATFSPDGMRVVTASFYKTVKTWTAAPFRGQEQGLPGDASTPWPQRFEQWKHDRYQAWLKRHP